MKQELIRTDDKGYHRLNCGCKIGRLMSIYCGTHTVAIPPHSEQQIIRRIWHKVTSQKS